MAQIKEFKALRFTQKAGNIAELCCPPYDIISETEREEYLRANPYNIIKLESPTPTPEGYAGANAELQERIANGIMAEDSLPQLYIYEEEFSIFGKKYSFKGFTAYVKLHEFSEGIVLPHEHTLSKAKTDRLNLLTATGCSFSQIYSLYNDDGSGIPTILEELSFGRPDNEFCDREGVTHRLWAVPESEKTHAICEAFKDKKLYIADGHHRYETALNFRRKKSESGEEPGNADYIMMFLINMDNPGLVVLPTHRIIKNLNNFNSAEFIKAAEQYFDVSSGCEKCLKAAEDSGKTAFLYYDGSDKLLLTLKPETDLEGLLPNISKALRQLDVTVLHSLLLEGILGIDKQNLANQINVQYTRSAEEAFSATENGADCCFILNATKVEQISAVAKAHEVMPQKSTYFYPKLTTGLVVNKVF